MTEMRREPPRRHFAPLTSILSGDDYLAPCGRIRALPKRPGINDSRCLPFQTWGGCHHPRLLAILSAQMASRTRRLGALQFRISLRPPALLCQTANASAQRAIMRAPPISAPPSCRRTHNGNSRRRYRTRPNSRPSPEPWRWRERAVVWRSAPDRRLEASSSTS
jgi:hypothetical protein